jgi:putative sigma-54 modulation protein
MQFSTTFRHMEVSAAVKEYAEERLLRIKKYFQREPLAAHATFSVERNLHHTAEFSVTLPNGILIQARDTTEDMYSSVDLAVARMERQVRKWKEKIRSHKPHGGPSFSVRQLIVPAEHVEPQPGPSPENESANAFPVVKEGTHDVKVWNVQEAAMQLNLMEKKVMVFIDATTQHISVIYRRKEGDYGLIETGVAVPQS